MYEKTKEIRPKKMKNLMVEFFVNPPEGTEHGLKLIKSRICTANIFAMLSTAFGSVTFASVIWLYILQPKIAIDLKLCSSISVNVTCTVIITANDCKLVVNICSAVIPTSGSKLQHCGANSISN